MIADTLSTTFIDTGWTAEMLSAGELLLTVAGSVADAGPPVAGLSEAGSRPSACTSAPGATAGLPSSANLDVRHKAKVIRSPKSEIRNSPDPVMLEIFNNLLASTAEQMGTTLRNTASSVNVKERLDFSCAIFTADGRLVVNAPHVPVHLGAMEETVRQVIAANPGLVPGDVIVTNDPYAGGSHLPDITVVTPVYSSSPPCSGEGHPFFSPAHFGEGLELLFFTASRAHHAEIGGIAHGSMPPQSENLAQEGVLIQNFKLMDRGQPRWDDFRNLILSAPYPTRDVDTNLADVAAQIAANHQGARDLLALVDRYSLPRVRQLMDAIQDAAETKVRAALSRLPAGTHSFTDYLEVPITNAALNSIRNPKSEIRNRTRSIPVHVTFTLHPPTIGPAATIDFTGTGPVVEGNLNANPAIVTAAVIYVLRLLVAEDIPLNHGVLRPVEIVLPRCLLNPSRGPTPETTPAVAGGNVETSQRIVDVLLGALGIAGASQGTMNNVIFGDATFGYYETICGGSGATADGPGASAIQVHMTNTRLTDPEILERRCPVRLHEFAIRRGSGGNGQHRGGDGVIRKLEFLRPLTLSLLTGRRGPHPPYGAQGGQPGALGRNQLLRTNGTLEDLPAIAQLEVAAGDTLIIQSPGAGGYGEPAAG